MYIVLHVKCPLFLSNYNESGILSTFSKTTQISNFMKIRPVGAELFHADGQTDSPKNVLIYRVIKNVHIGFHVKYPFLFSDFNGS